MKIKIEPDKITDWLSAVPFGAGSVRRGSLTPPTLGPEVSHLGSPLETNGRVGGKVGRPCHNW
ncbi:MAG: hypothetical protein ACP5XB_24235 [Isosphaeraceae bacterium]